MFFIVPIGSEEGVRRLPYVTIGLIVLNTLIYFITSMVLSAQISDLEKLDSRLFNIEKHYMYRVIETDPNLLSEYDIEEIRERFLEDEIIPPDTEDYREWRRLYEEFKEKSRSTIFDQYGFTPNKFNFLKIFSAIFVHANFFHLLFNMLFLWLVGCNIEDDWSWKIFIALYLMSGFVACIFHMIAFPESSVPLVGASGAIAGIMGAFMIRHYKTKIRFAYFFWIIFFRPYFGTFSIYAGIALPLWFIQQAFGASWSVESGTAYWAHISGFVFGAIVGVSLKVLGLEKKYIVPMVEDSFEKLKVSPRMKEVNKKLAVNDISGAIPLLLAIMNEESQSFDAPLILARIYFKKGHHDDAVVMYNNALEIMIRVGEAGVMLATFEEIKEKNLMGKISEKRVYNCAALLEKQEKYEGSVKLFGVYIRLFPDGKVRPKAIYRTYLIFRDKLRNDTMAQNALEFLKKEYPDFPIL